MSDLTKEDQKVIVQQEIKNYNAEKYRLQLRHKVQTELGNEKKAKQIEEDLVKVEQAIQVLSEME